MGEDWLLFTLSSPKCLAYNKWSALFHWISVLPGEGNINVWPRKSKEVQKRSRETRHTKNTNILVVSFGRTPIQKEIKRRDGRWHHLLPQGPTFPLCAQSGARIFFYPRADFREQASADPCVDVKEGTAAMKMGTRHWQGEENTGRKSTPAITPWERP